MSKVVSFLNDEKISLPKAEVTMIGYNFDETGKTFLWNSRVFRLIYPRKIKEAKELLSCGLIEELVQRGLFPETTITPYLFCDYDFILEHEKISPVIYPANWSFDMLKDAALCILEVNSIARKYGYQTIDGHGFNILFKEGHPVFIDFGSFIKNTENPKGWRAFEEFKRYYYYPLKVFKSGNSFLGRAILTQGNEIMPHSSYYQYRYPFLRLLPSDKIDRIENTAYKLKAFSHFTLEEIKSKTPKKFRSILLYMKKHQIRLFQTVNYNKQIKRVKRIKLPLYQSQWGDYHDQFLEQGKKIISSSKRFNRIIEIIKELQPNTIIEVGGNQGVFSELILQDTDVQNVICTDYDEIAVNKMYNRIKSKNLKITPSLLNIISPSSIDYGFSIEQRYQSEMLISLALTHHLILTQKIPLQKVFEQFSKFSTKYVITEFMPLGLYNPKAKQNESPPEWYTEKWFQAEFEKQYKLLYHEPLEQNRILFVGLKLNS